MVTPLAAQTVFEKTLATANVPTLIQSLKDNSDIYGNIVLGMKARERLAAIGRADSAAVVPLIIQELQAPRSATRRAEQQRIWLMGVLQDMGPAAEAAVPILTEIAADTQERNEYVKLQATSSLLAIGTPDAETATRRAAEQTAQRWTQEATAEEIHRSVEENAFLIRLELRSRSPSDEPIEVALINLQVAGQGAAAATPTLLRAYNDARLGRRVHAQIVETLKAAGVRDIEQSASKLPEESDLLGAVIADTKNPIDLINSLAMSELGKLGPSDRVIDALIEALRAGRSPGAAARELGSFGEAAARALPDLLPYLEDERAGANAIQAVGKIGNPAPSVVAILRRMVATSGSRHRGMAAATLGELKVVEGVPDLIAALSDDRKYTRILAANALRALGPEAEGAVKPLTGLLVDPDKDVRRAGTEALGRIGPASEVAVPLIAQQLDSSDTRLKQSARLALWQIGGELAEANLEAEAQRHAPADRADYRHLRESGDTDDLHRLLKSLPEARRLQLARTMGRDENPEIASLAAWTFIEAGRSDDAVPILAEMVARSDQDGEAFGGLGWAMMHSDRSGEWEQIVTAVVKHLNASMRAYSPEEQERIERVLGERSANLQ